MRARASAWQRRFVRPHWPSHMLNAVNELTLRGARAEELGYNLGAGE